MTQGLTPRLDQIVAGTQGFVDESALITAGTGNFITQIVGRAPIPDIANDLKASLGIERIPVQQIYPLQNEFGPDGQPVYGALNDTRGLIRFVGAWANVVGSSGACPYTTAATDYVEITFYGTGLNLLSFCQADSRDCSVTIDGVLVRASGVFPGPSAANVLGSRGYGSNQVLPITLAPLSLGIHTIKLIGLNVTCYGFEILNPNASGLININPGVANNKGAKYINSVARSIAYNQNQAGDTVITGTKGGRIVRYINADNTIGTAFQAVDVSAAYLASADHTNEEVARTYYWREFGAGRYSPADDFSLIATQGGGDYTFTLEDGTATLAGKTVALGGDWLAIIATGANTFFTFTFVGTGLDLIAKSSATNFDSQTISVDGASVGSISTTPAAGKYCKFKICSGLDYGTHTVKILRTVAAVATFDINSFIVYQPKKPAIPTGAVEIADYNVLGTYTLFTGTVVNNTGITNISKGTLYKPSFREFVYVGSSWAWVGIDPAGWFTGTALRTSTINDYVEYTFWGTGFEMRSPQNTDRGNVQVSLQNLSAGGSLLPATLANFPGTTFNSFGYATPFSSSTGIITANGAYQCGCIAGISGLPLSLYKVRFTYANTASYMYIEGISVITPIHTHKSNLYGVLQNTLPVGSCSMLDMRATSYANTQKAWAQAVGVNSTTATSSLTFVPCPDLSVTVKTSGSPIRVSFLLNANNAGAQGIVAIFVDGVQRSTEMGGFYDSDSASRGAVGDSVIYPVSRGEHKVDIYWRVTGGTLNGYDVMRSLTVEEL